MLSELWRCGNTLHATKHDAALLGGQCVEITAGGSLYFHFHNHSLLITILNNKANLVCNRDCHELPVFNNICLHSKPAEHEHQLSRNCRSLGYSTTAAAISRTSAQDSLVKAYNNNMIWNVTYRRHYVGIPSTVLWLRIFMGNYLSRNSLHAIRRTYTLCSLYNSGNKYARFWFQQCCWTCKFSGMLHHTG